MDIEGSKLSDLLIKYRGKIDLLKQSIKDVTFEKGDVVTRNGDEIFLLRYLLSFKSNVDKASKAIRKCVQWRKRYSRELAQIDVNKPIVVDTRFAVLQTAGAFQTQKHGLCYVVRMGDCDFSSVAKSFCCDEAVLVQTLVKEYYYRIFDELTRKTGIVHKLTSIVDLKGVSLTNRPSIAWIKFIGAASHVGAFLYPQMQSKTVFVNVSTIFKILYSIGSKFMNPQATAKVKVCDGNSGKSCVGFDCPICSDDVPKFLRASGKLACPPNLELRRERGWTDVLVPARKKKIIKINVPSSARSFQVLGLVHSSYICVELLLEEHETKKRKKEIKLKSEKGLVTLLRQQHSSSLPSTLTIVFNNLESFIAPMNIGYVVIFDSSPPSPPTMNISSEGKNLSDAVVVNKNKTMVTETQRIQQRCDSESAVLDL
jgi:hypothetical protein